MDAILYVLQCMAKSRVKRILGALMEGTAFQLVRFQNQPVQCGKGVAAGEIGGDCRLLLETNLVRNGLNRKQLEQHLYRNDRFVLVLTPDDVRPELFKEGSSRFRVGNFRP